MGLQIATNETASFPLLLSLKRRSRSYGSCLATQGSDGRPSRRISPFSGQLLDLGSLGFLLLFLLLSLFVSFLWFFLLSLFIFRIWTIFSLCLFSKVLNGLLSPPDEESDTEIGVPESLSLFSSLFFVGTSRFRGDFPEAFCCSFVL